MLANNWRFHPWREALLANNRGFHAWREVLFTNNRGFHAWREALLANNRGLHAWREVLFANNWGLHAPREALLVNNRCLARAKHTGSYPTIYLAAFSPVALRIKTTNIHDMLKAMMDAQGICNPRGTSSVRISVTAGPVKRKWII